MFFSSLGSHIWNCKISETLGIISSYSR
jgi:hypothetical protein